MPSYHKRYLEGECKLVWDEIYLLGKKALTENHYIDVVAVITEAMMRVRYNVDSLYQKLFELDYKFLQALGPARTYPDNDTEKLLSELTLSTGGMGHLPLTIIEFYRIVVSINFVWDYDNYPDDMWFEYADPLHVSSLPYILEEVNREDWKEQMELYISDGYSPSAYLDLSPDYYHKDNVSGGLSYGLELTKMPSVDSRVLFEDSNTRFVEYLRKCFEWGGFPRVFVKNKGYEEKILYLKNGLKMI